MEACYSRAVQFDNKTEIDMSSEGAVYDDVGALSAPCPRGPAEPLKIQVGKQMAPLLKRESRTPPNT
jgi:hypothetical protein